MSNCDPPPLLSIAVIPVRVLPWPLAEMRCCLVCLCVRVVLCTGWRAQATTTVEPTPLLEGHVSVADLYTLGAAEGVVDAGLLHAMAATHAAVATSAPGRSGRVPLRAFCRCAGRDASTRAGPGTRRLTCCGVIGGAFCRQVGAVDSPTSVKWAAPGGGWHDGLV